MPVICYLNAFIACVFLFYNCFRGFDEIREYNVTLCYELCLYLIILCNFLGFYINQYSIQDFIN